MSNIPDTKVHLGRKIKRIREIKGLKQEALAILMGESQQTVSKLEQLEDIDDDRLQKIATALEVSVDAIKNFSEEAAINIISSTLHDNAGSVNYNFNPVEKIVELYERLLETERKHNEQLERLINKK